MSRRRPGYGGAGTPPAGVAEQRLESPVRPGVAQRSVAGPSPGRGFAADAPFPLQDQEGRLQALQTLYEEAGEHKLASEITAL